MINNKIKELFKNNEQLVILPLAILIFPILIYLALAFVWLYSQILRIAFLPINYLLGV